MFTYNEVQLINVNISKTKKWLGYAVYATIQVTFLTFFIPHIWFLDNNEVYIINYMYFDIIFTI